MASPLNFIDPMAQVIFNILVTLCGLLGGYVLKSIQATLANMLREQRDLANKLQAIEVLVAGEYVRKDEFTRVADALFARFDRIESKLDNKEDRHP